MFEMSKSGAPTLPWALPCYHRMQCSLHANIENDKLPLHLHGTAAAGQAHLNTMPWQELTTTTYWQQVLYSYSVFYSPANSSFNQFSTQHFALSSSRSSAVQNTIAPRWFSSTCINTSGKRENYLIWTWHAYCRISTNKLKISQIHPRT